MQRIWDGLSDDSQFWLFSTAKGSSNPTESPSEYLKTGLIRGEKNSWKFFSPLFKQYILNLAELKLPEIKQDNDRLIVAGQDAEKLLSNKQFDFFTLLWEKKDKITSRNEIAQILWGENWVDKYSDWAIDQFVKRTRNRINDRGDKKVIKTVRGKGYTLGME
jgi:DNA-binding response OmpR family regulator